MKFPNTTTLRVWKPTITGCGEEIVLNFRAGHKSKTGIYSLTDLRLRLDRYLVVELAAALASMQDRDRARIAVEVERLRTEMKPLTGAKTT